MIKRVIAPCADPPGRVTLTGPRFYISPTSAPFNPFNLDFAKIQLFDNRKRNLDLCVNRTFQVDKLKLGNRSRTETSQRLDTQTVSLGRSPSYPSVIVIVGRVRRTDSAVVVASTTRGRDVIINPYSRLRIHRHTYPGF